jgi:hypothetical protein
MVLRMMIMTAQRSTKATPEKAARANEFATRKTHFKLTQ